MGANYKCSLCDYSSTKMFNVERHTKAKHSDVNIANSSQTVCRYCARVFTKKYNCQRHETVSCTNRPISQPAENVNMPAEFVNMPAENVNRPAEFVNIPAENVNIEQSSEVSSPYKCELCYKSFTRKYWRNEHMSICKRTENPLQCHKCKQVFACRQTKSIHMKTCTAIPLDTDVPKQKDVVPIQESIINNNTTISNSHNTTNNTINNTTNNNTININLSDLHINDFGHETGGLLTDELLDCWYNYNGKGVLQLIKKIHFNQEYPENHNLRQGRNKRRMRVRENGNWIEYSFFDKYSGILQRYTDLLHKRLLDPMVRANLGQQELHDRYNALKTIDVRKNPNEYYTNMESFRVMLENVEKSMIEQAATSQTPMIEEC